MTFVSAAAIVFISVVLMIGDVVVATTVLVAVACSGASFIAVARIGILGGMGASVVGVAFPGEGESSFSRTSARSTADTTLKLSQGGGGAAVVRAFCARIVLLFS